MESTPRLEPGNVGRRRSHQERSSETRRKIIDAAIALVREYGFSRLTINDAAHRAGLTSGAIQHHFTNRHLLIRGLVDELYPVLHIGIDHIAAANRPIPERVDRLVDAYWSMYRKSEYLVFWELVFGTREYPEFREYIQSLQKEIVSGAVADLIRLFVDVDIPQRRVRELFVFITCQLRGLALLALFENSTALHTDLRLLKQTACQLVQMGGAERSA